MTFEVALVTGCVLAVLSVVSALSAIIEGRRPRVASIVVVISGGLILGAATIAPDGLQFSDVPQAFVSIIASVLN